MEPLRCQKTETANSSPASATIKTPGIQYEYRGFSNFFGLFENAHGAILGHFWVTPYKTA